MKFLGLAALMLFSLSSFASIVKSADTENQCTLYRSTKDETGDDIRRNEKIVIKKPTYGMSIIDLKIDFENQQVTVMPFVHVALGLDRQLNGKRAIIDRSNKNFDFLVNQINRKVFFFEKICIDREDKLIYATMPASELK